MRLADIRQMSLKEKVGQMFMCGFSDTAPDAHIRKLIREHHIGGVIYFRRNIRTAEQVGECSFALQQESAIPLLISIDQEGGMVARIEDGVTLMPGNMAIGAARDTSGAYDAARITGKELRELGINMNFAPCVDINNNPLNPVIGVRSYGETPELVSEMGVAQVRGYQDAGVAATIKHFPGHGDTSADSHRELPKVPHDRKRLNQVELVPFREAISAGVDAVMTAHVIFPAYEERDIPATLSSKILTGLLRGELGFDGVITTDCLEMNAIWKTVGVGRGAVMAVQAGADLVLISHTLDLQVEGIEAVIRAVEAGEISEARIDESVARLLRLKEKRGLFTVQPFDGAGLRSRIGQDSSWAVARQLSEKSITVVKDEGMLPLSRQEKTFVVWPEVRVGTEVDEVIAQEVTLGSALSEWVNEVKEVKIGVEPDEAEIAEVLDASVGFAQVVVATYNATFSRGQQLLVRELAQRTGSRLAVASLRNPFDLTSLPEIQAYVACYENKPLTMKSLAKVLVGEIPARGALPVTVVPILTEGRATKSKHKASNQAQSKDKEGKSNAGNNRELRRKLSYP